MDVLIVESNPQIADGLRRAFEQRGHTATCVTEEFVSTDADTRYAVLLIDWELPGAAQLVANLRRTGRMAPVLALGPRQQPEDLVSALQAGADDFIVKTDTPVEVLIARTSALSRRANLPPTPRRIEANGIIIDEGMNVVTVNGKTIHVAHGDLRVLGALAAAMGRVVSREELVTVCWGERAEVTTNALESSIKRIRRALGKQSTRIRSIRLRGYSLSESAID